MKDASVSIITIITVVYNAVDLIEETIRCVLEQNCKLPPDPQRIESENS